MAAYRLNAAIDPEQYEMLLFYSYNLGMLGCEEQGTAEGLRVDVYFKDELSAQTAVEKLKPYCRKNISVEKIEGQDWNAKWRESMKPARLAAGWWVSPLWLPPPAEKHWIKIEPKMAFGTGHHETTRLAAQAVIAVKRRLKNGRMLDIGTGSGVLCFTAALCGARCCVGVEIDQRCRENLAENRRLNNSVGRIGFLIGRINALKVERPFDLITMNMILTESAPLLEAVAALCAPAGLLIWSGILAEEYARAVELATKHRFSLRAEKRENEWWCGTFGTIKQ
jgi:ribosomal protein L11 methyltransferase